MSYFRKTEHTAQMLELIAKDQKWLLLINADPDAMASAMAFKRILSSKGVSADIARINDISRPDNLAMIRHTQLRMRRFQPSLLECYNRFALLDSQPSHNPQFEAINFFAIIDHHPLETAPDAARFIDIKPEYGAASTMLTEYLYNLGIKPGARLATALQFGIRTDTRHFQRNVHDVDMRAYQYLSKFADSSMLARIMRSEFHMDWLPYFARAIEKLRQIKTGHMVFLGEVESPDIIVLLADLFTRVYEIRWVAVAGTYDKTAVISFRGDGVYKDLGSMAHDKFNSFGSAGGHKALARAEFPADICGEKDLEEFIYCVLTQNSPSKCLPPDAEKQAEEPETQ